MEATEELRCRLRASPLPLMSPSPPPTSSPAAATTGRPAAGRRSNARWNTGSMTGARGGTRGAASVAVLAKAAVPSAAGSAAAGWLSLHAAFAVLACHSRAPSASAPPPLLTHASPDSASSAGA